MDFAAVAHNMDIAFIHSQTLSRAFMYFTT